MYHKPIDFGEVQFGEVLDKGNELSEEDLTPEDF